MSLSSLADAYLQLIADFLPPASWARLLSTSHAMRLLRDTKPAEFGRNYVFHQIQLLQAVVEQRRNTVLTGAAGAGKSYLIKAVVREATKAGMRVQCTGMTGMACLQLPDANTLHSFSKLQTGTISMEDLEEKIAKEKKKKYRQSYMFGHWRRVDLLIIDEVSMLGASFLAKVERTARAGRGRDDLPFGGVQVLLVGDWFQLEAIGDQPCFTSPLWPQLNLVNVVLTVIHRQNQDPQFRFLLNRLRLGEHTAFDVELLRRRREITAGINWDLRDKLPIHLFPYNKDVLRVNLERFNRVPGPVIHTSHAVDVVLKRMQHIQITSKAKMPTAPYYLPTTELSVADALRGSMSAALEVRRPQTLQFKEGAQYVLTRNVDLKKGWVNGSRVIYHFVAGQHLMEFSDGATLGLAALRVAQKFPILGRPGFLLERTQYAVKWGYATSIHGVQGATYDEVMVSVGSEVRQAAQVYVALSRVRSLEGLYINDFDPRAIKTSLRVKRFYSEMVGG